MGQTCGEMWTKAYRKWEKSWENKVRMDMAGAPCKEEKDDGILGPCRCSNPDEECGLSTSLGGELTVVEAGQEKSAASRVDHVTLRKHDMWGSDGSHTPMCLYHRA